MKKAAVLIVAIIGLAVWALGGREFISDPMRSLESFALRHADSLPLAYFGEIIFDRNCAVCHDDPQMRAPTREALSGFSKESLLIAMEFGKMQPMAAHLDKREQGLIALYLAGKAENVYDWIDAVSCQRAAGEDDTLYVGNWGLGNKNQRFVPSAIAGVDRDSVGQLELAWSFAFPRVSDVRSQPAIIGDTLYIGDKAGKLYALDRKTGCVRAHTTVLTGVRSAITVARLNNGERQLIFADSLATVFAVDPESLEILWQSSARVFDTSIVTGSISFHNDRLFVPVSSYEVAVSGSPDYACCKSHGAVLALDASDGSRIWDWHATADAELQGRTTDGIEQYGPSGAVVWTTPAIDDKRNVIYFGTGENLSHPATDTSDSIIALDMDTGELQWRFQAIAGDVWNSACLTGGAGCPENPGGDFDFGASVIMANFSDGREVLLAGQKSGEVFALNPDPESPEGEVLWRNRISQGTTNGGIHWGMAVSGQRLIVPVADPERERQGYSPRPGLYALDISSGEVLWQTPVARSCEFDPSNKPLVGLANTRSGAPRDLEAEYRCSFFYGLSSAAIATGQIAFSGGLDGRIRAYDIENGQILWQDATARAFDASNGLQGHGGAIDVAGQVVADGWLYVLSGYSMFGQLPGNMLLAYKVTP